MKNAKHTSRKAQQKRRETLFFGVIIALLILAVVLSVVQLIWGKEETTMQYTITSDGHVHTADGGHVGTVEELFGDLVVTEDGHLHAADGTHIGNIDEIGMSDEATPAEASAE